MIMSGGRNRSPIFTASQWQELEQQTLIFKYMVSEVPIPPDLISTVRRSLEYSSTFSRFILRQPTPQNNPTHNLFMDSGSYSQTHEDSFTPLTMSSSPSGYSQSHYFQSLTGESREQHQQQKEKSSFLLGTDFKSERPIKGEREEENQMPFHHFFGEKPFHGFSTTQFSISMPPSTQELFGSKSTFHTDG
ncbi:hypothetical protein Acr_11g0015060 [Actinidia rufa]|uniref:Growth-regulating factor n=1 Tax=Actinidia rufa TaxID=165716 RepID=A0A7J0FER4_9ERIC|nr:hypothetical protein Acr_11g0015060 [Actinidia rufa]